MARVEHSVVIDRPVEDVWSFMADPENDSQWVSGVVESAKTSEGPMGLGATLKIVRNFLGRRIEADLELTEWEPNKRSAIRSTSGPISVAGTRTFEAVEGGTRVTDEVEADLRGFFRLAEPLVERTAQRQIESDYESLKGILESQT